MQLTSRLSYGWERLLKLKCYSVEVTYMVKLEMNAEEGRSISKAASLVMGSWFHTELWTVVTA